MKNIDNIENNLALKPYFNSINIKSTSKKRIKDYQIILNQKNSYTKKFFNFDMV